MRILFIGDIVGEPGRKIAMRGLPILRKRWSLDLIVANAENSAGGSGITTRCFNQLAQAGVDAFTMGDHVYRIKDVFELFGKQPPMSRPANFPAEAPGPDHVLVETKSGVRVAVLSVLGRLFLKPIDCPFRAVDRILSNLEQDVQVVIVDVHAEATSEKQALLRHLVGRVSAVLGTHTHVPTADAAVFPPGTAYCTDVGMTGPYDGVIGRDWKKVLHTMLTQEPVFFDVAKADARISGALFDVDPTTGRATSCRLAHLTEADLDALADAPELDQGGGA
jgi:metallophosphoesterase (TIGR00282 family)